MKRTLSLILILAMLLSLAACGSKDTPAPDNDTPPQEQGSGDAQPSGTADPTTDPTTDEQPAKPEQAQPSEQEPEDSSKPAQEPEDNSKPEQEPAKEPEKQPEQKPAEKPTEEKPAEEKPAEQPSETPEPEKPAEDKPTAAADDTLAILETVWNTYSDDERFPAAGGDSSHAADGAPGSFDVSSADSLGYMLTFPTDDASLIDSAASLVHMMNLNTFTCGAFRAVNAQDVTKLADDLHTTVQAKHWMCGFPEKLVIATVGQCVISVYGNENLVNTFRDKLLASYSAAAVVYDEAINT